MEKDSNMQYLTHLNRGIRMEREWHIPAQKRNIIQNAI